MRTGGLTALFPTAAVPLRLPILPACAVSISRTGRPGDEAGLSSARRADVTAASRTSGVSLARARDDRTAVLSHRCRAGPGCRAPATRRAAAAASQVRAPSPGALRRRRVPRSACGQARPRAAAVGSPRPSSQR